MSIGTLCGQICSINLCYIDVHLSYATDRPGLSVGCLAGTLAYFVSGFFYLAGNVGDMSATWRNVAYFRPDRAKLATCFLVCRLTFVSQFPDMFGPRTDNICT